MAFSLVARLRSSGRFRHERPVGCPLDRTGGVVSPGFATEKTIAKSSGFAFPRESEQRTKKLYMPPLVSPETTVDWDVPPVTEIVFDMEA